MDIQSFFLRDFIRENEVLHLARVTIYSRRDISLHKHDFAEIFWVENGSGTHLINGREIKLEPGDLVMIRPDDQHTFTSSKKGLTIMNLAFSTETLHYLRARYFPDVNYYFWTDEFLPFTKPVDIKLINQISKRAEESFKFRNSLLYLDSLLLFIFRSIAANEDMSVNKQIPIWLHNAMQDFCTPELFKQGYGGFVNICEKNIDHINRTVRKFLNKSLSDLIAELRMSFAAKQLVITKVPIKTICSDCGFNSLGHFYKTFKKIYHLTPFDYRKINQNVA
ncbi:MAG TPA: helix-turn-helix domain-containing protein [Chitinophagaceae bacterium]|nr:helix-turn-helix domain-containing protein [Chitinophagaceae bacterium]